MKIYSFLLATFLCLPAIGQQRLEIGLNGSCDFPVSIYRWKLYESLTENGGASKNGWGGISLYFIIRQDIFFMASHATILNLRSITLVFFPRRDFFINHSPDPSRYDQTSYAYNVYGDSWRLLDIAIPFGVQAKIKKIYISANARAGIMTVFSPIVSINEYQNNPSTQPNQTVSQFMQTMDHYSAKPNLLFSYGCDLKIGYDVYKNLNLFTGFTYTGTTNANVTYFDEPSYGYKKTIQTVGVTVGLSYTVSLKNTRRKSS